jgi:hypothetical protein
VCFAWLSWLPHCPSIAPRLGLAKVVSCAELDWSLRSPFSQGDAATLHGQKRQPLFLARVLRIEVLLLTSSVTTRHWRFRVLKIDSLTATQSHTSNRRDRPFEKAVAAQLSERFEDQLITVSSAACSKSSGWLRDAAPARSAPAETEEPGQKWQHHPSPSQSRAVCSRRQDFV